MRRHARINPEFGIIHRIWYNRNLNNNPFENSFMTDGCIEGFNPIGDKMATVLILGTMPGQESLNKAEYYAHRRNAFWNIMGEIFGAGFNLEYEQRQNILIQNGIAVWDVLKCCQRKGSSDSNIEGESVNDFDAFFCGYPKIRNVFFNGKSAERFYQRLALPQLSGKYQHIIYQGLPSTSPANAQMDFQMKLTEWHAVAKGKNPNLKKQITNKFK